jgi:hypothetical protein
MEEVMWSVEEWDFRRKGWSTGSLTKKTVYPVAEFGVLVPKGVLGPNAHCMERLGSWRWMERQFGQGANTG